MTGGFAESGTSNGRAGNAKMKGKEEKRQHLAGSLDQV
jgi:hypothetical protein